MWNSDGERFSPIKLSGYPRLNHNGLVDPFPPKYYEWISFSLLHVNLKLEHI